MVTCCTEEHQSDDTEQLSVFEQLLYDLCELQKSSNGETYAYGRAQIYSHKCIINDKCRKFTHVTKLNLTKTGLDNSEFLQYLPFISQLTISDNKLEELNGLVYCEQIEYVDVSKNQIKTLPNLCELLYLKNLHADYNRLADLQGVIGCKRLQLLTLSHNELSSAALLVSRLDHTQYCSVSQRNQLENIMDYRELLPFINPPFWTLPQLRELDLSYNSKLYSAVSVLLPVSLTSKARTLEQDGLYQNGLFPSTVTTLRLNGCGISLLSGLKNLSGLHIVELRDNFIGDICQLRVFEDKRFLRFLDLRNNPVVNQNGYKMRVYFEIDQLEQLDYLPIAIEDKVRAKEYFSPTMQQIASRDHRINTLYQYTGHTNLRDCTLPSTDTPYPILALIGPTGANKRHLARLLISQFRKYFGLLKSHTTCPGARSSGRSYKTPDPPRPQSAKERSSLQSSSSESHSSSGLLDTPDNKHDDEFYHHVDQETFEQMQVNGEFIQTAKLLGHQYGLSWNELNDMALRGLAGVFTGELEAKLSLSLSCLRPRYILCLPRDTKEMTKRLQEQNFNILRSNHMAVSSMEQMMKERQCMIEWCLERTRSLYRKAEQEQGDEYDAIVYTDNVEEAFEQLAQLVRQYLD